MGTEPVIGMRMRVPPARGLGRPRVDALVDRCWQHRLTLVSAPVGSGKTTALAHFAARLDAPVAWYCADATDATVTGVCAGLAAALTVALPGLALPGLALPGLAPLAPDVRLEHLVAALDAWSGARAALVLDDLHLLRGQPGEALVPVLAEALPARVALLVATRGSPSFDVSRLRLAGELLEITGDDLRFRTWEAERLLQDEHRLALRPEHIARLTRRTEGWAAALQLFQITARRRSPAEQVRLIDSAGSRSRVGREYLARNVLHDVEPALQEFLVDTCVLGVITPWLADHLRDRRDSVALLAALEDAWTFTVPCEDDGAVRYHEVVRAHLEALLVERDGEQGARRRHGRAGALLEAEGFPADALRCYGRAGDWTAVSRLLGQADVDLEGTFRWLDTFPDAIVEGDPWLLLARGRARRAAGEMRRAEADLAAAEVLAGATPLGARCHDERVALAAWTDDRFALAPGWQAQLRSWLRAVPEGLVGPGSARDAGTTLAEGLAALAAGQPRRAIEPLAASLAHPGASAPLAAAARLAQAVGEAMRTGPIDDGVVHEAAEAAERAGIEWLARLARAGLALTTRRDGIDEASSVRARCDADGDRWGAALAALAEGLGRLLLGGDAAPTLDHAAHRFAAVRAPVPEALARAASAVALARLGRPEAAAHAAVALRLARTTRSPGARALALQALGADSRDPEVLTAGIDLGQQCGLDLAGTPERAPAGGEDVHAGGAPVDGVAIATDAAAAVPAPTVSIHCFGAFRVEVGGQPVNLRAVRPRARSVLRLLALHCGRPVHREALIEALWPSTPFEAGLRKLHVALSSLRQVMPPASRLAIEREAESYRLVVPAGAALDVGMFDAAAGSARRAAADGDHAGTFEAASSALSAYADDLLVEEGPAEWVVARRDQYRAEAVAAACLAAEAALELGKPDLAAAAADRGLSIDTYTDALWRLLVRAHVAAGDVVAAARAERSYARVRDELGVQ